MNDTIGLPILNSDLLINNSVTLATYWNCRQQRPDAWYSIFLFYFSNVKITDLAIPDTYCNPEKQSGYICPKGMVCMALSLSRKERGFNGFDEFRKYASGLRSQVWPPSLF